MIIITTMTFPTESGQDFSKRFTEVGLKPAPDMQVKGAYATNSMDGTFCFIIYEVDRNKLADGIEHLAKSMEKYRGIPGLKYEIKTWLEFKIV